MPDVAAYILGDLSGLPPVGLFALLFVGTFISEDAACLAAGAAVASGAMSFQLAVAGCLLGIFTGDMLLYGAGRLAGERIFTNAIVRRFVSEGTIDRATGWLAGNAVAAIFLSRFITGMRLPVYLAVGALRTDARKFAFFFLIAAAVWTPLVVGGTAFSQYALFGGNTILAVIAVFLMIRIASRYASRRNRRLLRGRLGRIVNWEFWPVHVLYTPVVVYILFLGLKHRGLTAFTAANPAIPAGGFVGESKTQIFELIEHVFPETVPAYTLIPGRSATSERLSAAWRFIDAAGLDLPLVVKPDAGERGKGVRIVNSIDDLNDAILNARGDLILQQHVGQVEASVFYYRYPGERRGRIFSITEKRFPAVTGDGRSTIEDLILNDRRAVCLAEKYFEENKDDLSRVLDPGERHPLIQIGTHSRGAIFVDGEWLRSEQLESRIDEISRSIDGFYFGRYDLRAPSFDDLRDGEFAIVELNGVTSESTNIYDPRYSLVQAYRILFEQWRIAFEIGALNVRRGARASTPAELASLIFRRKPGVNGRVYVRPLHRLS